MAEIGSHVNVDYVLNRAIGIIDEKLETGHSKRQIREDLAGMGFDADTANALIEQVDGPRRHELRLQGMQHCAGGLALALLGGAITLGTWFWASPGGTYFVTYGMMAVGGFYALVGALRSLINTSGPASFVRWAAGYALVFGLLGTGAFLLYGWTINAPPEAPPEIVDGVHWQEGERRAYAAMYIEVADEAFAEVGETARVSRDEYVDACALMEKYEWDAIDTLAEPDVPSRVNMLVFGLEGAIRSSSAHAKDMDSAPNIEHYTIERFCEDGLFMDEAPRHMVPISEKPR